MSRSVHTAQYRRALTALRLLTARDMARLWPLLDPQRLDETFPGYLASVGQVVASNRRTAAALARQYVALVRAESGIPGVPPTAEDPPLPVQQFTTALTVTSLASIKAATARGVAVETANADALVRATGAVTRLVDNASRDVVRASVDADPHAKGWTRVTGATPCEFCSGLANGEVLPGSIEMAAHDHDSCTAEPVYT